MDIQYLPIQIQHFVNVNLNKAIIEAIAETKFKYNTLLMLIARNTRDLLNIIEIQIQHFVNVNLA